MKERKRKEGRKKKERKTERKKERKRKEERKERKLSHILSELHTSQDCEHSVVCNNIANYFLCMCTGVSYPKEINNINYKCQREKNIPTDE
jgi:hypothetical protein